MNDEEIIVAYPHEIKFIDKNGGAISYYVDRKVSDCVKELQDKLSKIESENRQKDIDKLQLQSNWNSLREWLKNKIDNFQDDVSESILHEQMTMRVIYEYMENLDKMNELESGDNK